MDDVGGRGRPALDTRAADLDGRAHPGTDASRRFQVLVGVTAGVVGIVPALPTGTTHVEHKEINKRLASRPC